MPNPVPRKEPEIDTAGIFSQMIADAAEWDRRAHEVQAKAAHAFARLLDIAETSDTGQASRVAKFIAGSYNGRAFPFDLFDLRCLDVPISDDMLLCLDALRWAKADLYKLVPEGESRVKSVIKTWQVVPVTRDLAKNQDGND